MKKLVAFFYVDALNSGFLLPSIMPFLSGLAKKNHYGELRNVMGYSFAIQSCMLSGKYPEETNHWMPYFYSPERSPMLFDALSKIQTIFPLDRLPFLRHLTLAQVRRFLLRKGVHANNIPLNIIDKIALYPYYYMCQLPFFHDLRQLLEDKCQTSLVYVGPPEVRGGLYSSLLKHIGTFSRERELIIAYDDTMDGLGHKFGPYSTECLSYVKALDRVLLIVYQKLKKVFGEDLTFVVFSDHGQCEQTYNLDLLSRLGKKALSFGDDYMCFIDATLALFWPENKVVHDKILKILDGIRMGKAIDEDLQRRYHIKFKDKRYGEIIFVLEPGGTFFPNFFSSFSAMRGLHGYLPEEEVQKSFFISNKEIATNMNHIRDFRSFCLSVFPS